MPIYTYKCQVCGKEFDYKQSINDEPLKECPDEICEQHGHQKGLVTRIISKNIGLVFKGSGFYLTDYAKNKSVSSAPSTNGHSNGNSNSEALNTTKNSNNNSKNDSTASKATNTKVETSK